MCAWRSCRRGVWDLALRCRPSSLPLGASHGTQEAAWRLSGHCREQRQQLVSNMESRSQDTQGMLPLPCPSLLIFLRPATSPRRTWQLVSSLAVESCSPDGRKLVHGREVKLGLAVWPRVLALRGCMLLPHHGHCMRQVQQRMLMSTPGWSHVTGAL